MDLVTHRTLDDAKAGGIWPIDPPGFSSVFFGPGKMKNSIGLAYFS